VTGSVEARRRAVAVSLLARPTPVAAPSDRRGATPGVGRRASRRQIPAARPEERRCLVSSPIEG